MNLQEFKQGLKDGLPIGFGYFAVSFSLGITARNAGLNALEGGVLSLLMYASAGEYAILSLIAAGGSIFETIIMTLVVNMRYLLMGCALAQKIPEEEKPLHRLGIGACLTDEIFGISIARQQIHHEYPYAAWITAVSMWTLGTSAGILAGDILPVSVVEALSVAIYGMFIAIVIPAGKQDNKVMAAIVVSFVLSGLLNWCSIFSFLSPNAVIIILTIVISLFFAWKFPREETDE